VVPKAASGALLRREEFLAFLGVRRFFGGSIERVDELGHLANSVGGSDHDEELCLVQRENGSPDFQLPGNLGDDPQASTRTVKDVRKTIDKK